MTPRSPLHRYLPQAEFGSDFIHYLCFWVFKKLQAVLCPNLSGMEGRGFRGEARKSAGPQLHPGFAVTKERGAPLAWRRVTAAERTQGRGTLSARASSQDSERRPDAAAEPPVWAARAQEVLRGAQGPCGKRLFSKCS